MSSGLEPSHVAMRASRARAVRRRRRLLATTPLCLLLTVPLVLQLLPSHSPRLSRAAAAPARGAKTTKPFSGIPRRTPALASTAAQQRALQRLRRLSLPVYCGGDQHRVVALTFDDGPGRLTGRILGILRRAHATATFFPIGSNLAVRPKLVPAEQALGAIGDHTWSHPDLRKLTPSAVAWQLVRTRAAIEQAGGGYTHLFRAPYGSHNQLIDQVAAEHGLVEILWSIDTRDAEGASPTNMLATVAHFLKPGGIILMHENKPATLAALPRILTLLRHRHLRPVTIPQLLALNSPSPTVLRGGWPACFASPARAS